MIQGATSTAWCGQCWRWPCVCWWANTAATTTITIPRTNAATPEWVFRGWRCDECRSFCKRREHYWPYVPVSYGKPVFRDVVRPVLARLSSGRRAPRRHPGMVRRRRRPHGWRQR